MFENANIEIFDNKMNIIAGLNGAGKSTLLKIITGEMAADCKITNTFKNVFYMPQNPYYPPDVTTFDYLSSIFYKNNWKWFLDREEKEKIENALEKVELSDKRDSKIGTLSGGELQKANMALGLLSGADLFLLDEPASNLDLVNGIKILHMVKTLSEGGITSVVILHDLNLASSFGDWFIGIAKDGKIYQECKKNFFDVKILKQIYGIDFNVIKNDEKFYIQILD